jgi:hypothetical protein
LDIGGVSDEYIGPALEVKFGYHYVRLFLE